MGALIERGMVFFVGVVLSVGCGGDDGSGQDDAATQPDAAQIDAGPDASEACPAMGAATVTSTIPGVDVDPVFSAFVLNRPDGAVMVIDEAGAFCAPDTGGALGQHVVVLFCDPLSVAGYSVADEATFPAGPCPGQTVAAVFVENEEGEEAPGGSASGGTVTINSVGSKCVFGSFDTTNNLGQALSGSFEATVCP